MGPDVKKVHTLGLFSDVATFNVGHLVIKEPFVSAEGGTSQNTHMIIYFCPGTIQFVGMHSWVTGNLLFAGGYSCSGR